MNTKVVARRSRVRLEALLANGVIRLNESANQFYDSEGWVPEEVTFTFEGDVQVDSNGIAFGGEYVFLRDGQSGDPEWYLVPTDDRHSDYFDSVELSPTIA